MSFDDRETSADLMTAEVSADDQVTTVCAAEAEPNSAVDGPLSAAETERLGLLETTIDRNLVGFVEAGNALREIRDARLYRGEYQSFDAYLRDRWGMKAKRAYQMVDAAGVFENLLASTMVDTLPENERQVRPLTTLPPDQQPAAWSEAVDTAPRGPTGSPTVTGAHVASVAEKVRRRAAMPGDSSEGTATASAPWDAFNKAVQERVIGTLRTACREMKKIGEYDKDIKRFRNQFAQGLTPHGTLDSILTLARCIESCLPAEPSDKHPGYLTRASVKVRDDHLKSRQGG